MKNVVPEVDVFFTLFYFLVLFFNYRKNKGKYV